MKRRSLIGMMLGSVAGLFASRAKAEPVPVPVINVDPYPAAVQFDPTKANRDGAGRAICRIYRETPDGTWREIQQRDIQPGDKIICIGQDGDRLWRAAALRVEQPFPPDAEARDSGGVMYTDVNSLMTWHPIPQQ